jgi:hypothetical protein
VYALFASVLLPAVSWYHEPWADEAQAWLLCRDSSLLELLWERLRYEGHPSLWYLILYVPSKLLPYGSMRVIAVLIFTTSIAVVVFRSPFPRSIAALLPFMFFVSHQYSMIAKLRAAASAPVSPCERASRPAHLPLSLHSSQRPSRGCKSLDLDHRDWGAPLPLPLRTCMRQ